MVLDCDSVGISPWNRQKKGLAGTDAHEPCKKIATAGCSWSRVSEERAQAMQENPETREVATSTNAILNSDPFTARRHQLESRRRAHGLLTCEQSVQACQIFLVHRPGVFARGRHAAHRWREAAPERSTLGRRHRKLLEMVCLGLEGWSRLPALGFCHLSSIKRRQCNGAG